jgi:hypothetical protein
MTYRELATRLGIKIESARKTVQRQNWKREEGHGGIVMVFVPEDYFVGKGHGLSPPPAIGGELGRGMRSEVALEFLEDVLAMHSEKIGPVLRSAIARLDRDIIKRLVMDVASKGI